MATPGQLCQFPLNKKIFIFPNFISCLLIASIPGMGRLPRALAEWDGVRSKDFLPQVREVSNLREVLDLADVFEGNALREAWTVGTVASDPRFRPGWLIPGSILTPIATTRASAFALIMSTVRTPTLSFARGCS